MKNQNIDDIIKQSGDRMGKIANAIQMLDYLNTGNKYSVKDLSKRLGITERMVRYYKTELEQIGIPIETFMGPNGGYYILNVKTDKTGLLEMENLDKCFEYGYNAVIENLEEIKQILKQLENKGKKWYHYICTNGRK